MKEEKIQTQHPIHGKVNKNISLGKYKFIKENLLKIPEKAELNHTDLMERVYENVKDNFEGGVQWYGETVKLDLEARNMIKRNHPKPEIYSLIKKEN